MSFGARLRTLGSDAAVYGIAHVVGRFVGFLLNPLYTNVLHRGDYGSVSSVYSYIALALVLYGFGLETALLRFLAPDEKRDARTVFSTASLFLLGTAGASSILLVLLAAPVAGAIGIPEHPSFVKMTAGILLLDSLQVLPFAYLRLRRMARAYAVVRLLSILVNVGLNVFLLVRLGHGPAAVFEANLASSALGLLLLLPVYENLLRPIFDRRVLRELLAFSLPLVPSQLAAIVVQVADRPILQHLTDEATVGVYTANYRLGIVMMLVVSVFQYAWQPFFLARGRDPDARPLFARVLTYYLLAALSLFLAITLLLDRIVALPVGRGRTFIGIEYWSGLAVVPWVLLGYVALGVYTNLTAGPTLEKRTRLFPWVTGLAALVNVGLNLALVPRYGMLAAGWATFAAYVVMAAAMWRVAARVYPVPYEWGRLLRLVLGALAIWAAFGSLGSYECALGTRALLLLAYPALLAATGFFGRGEVAAARRLVSRRRPPA